MKQVFKHGVTTEKRRVLRRCAEDRLKEELMLGNTLAPHDALQQLNELRINQIEIELLNEEFIRLRRYFFGTQRNAGMQKGMGYGYLFVNREGRICEEKFFGMPAEEGRVVKDIRKTSIGCCLGDFIAPENRAQLSDFLHETFESGIKNSCEISFLVDVDGNESGVRLPLFASIEAVADDEKRYCLMVLEDITKIRLAEEREKVSQRAMAMLEQTIAVSRNEIYVFDSQTLNFNFANHRALENLGYTLEDLRQLSPASIQTSVSNLEMNRLISYLLIHRKHVKKFNAVHKRKDGSLYPVEIFLQLFEYGAGSAFIAIILDVSAQMAVESQLKSIVKSAGAIIWAANTDLKLLFMSDQVQEILGYTTSQFVDSSLSELLDCGFFHESDRQMLLNSFNQVVVERKTVGNLRYRVKHADGNWRWFSMNMTPTLSVDGKVAQMVGVMHDIHTQILTEEALRQLNQELDSRVREEVRKNQEKDALLQRQARLAVMGEMIGNIAHQWRQPINSLGLILSDLEDAALYGESNLAYIQNAVAKSKKIIQKMSSTIDDFRHFFRTDKNYGVFSLKQITAECINLVEAAMKSNQIELRVHCEHDVLVAGYANEYSQALMNILGNAKDAIADRNGDGGVIEIEIVEEGDFGVQIIRDSGGGIADEVLPRIFEPHFTTKEHGVGIGLYMTLILVEKNMGGRINVENVAEGAQFSVYLPKVRQGE